MTDEKAKAAAEEVFTQYMKARKLRKTPERYAILARVFGTTGHFSIDTLHSDLEQQGYHVSRATVYNTIELLKDAGLVRRHAFGSQAPQYEKVAGYARHFHLVCTMCGRVKEIKDQEVDTILESRHYSGFYPAYADLNIYGTCGSCMRKRRRTARKK